MRIVCGWLRSVSDFRVLLSMFRFTSVFSIISLSEMSFKVLLVVERTRPPLFSQNCSTLWSIAIFLNEP